MTEPEYFEVGIRYPSEDRAVVTASGELDMLSAEALREALFDALANPLVVLDLSGVGFCDSGGLRVLIAAALRAEQSGRLFRVAAPSPPVAQIFGLTGVEELLKLYPDVDAALLLDD